LTAATRRTEDIRRKLKSISVVNRCAIHHGGMVFDKSGEALVAAKKNPMFASPNPPEINLQIFLS
jgi:hypothetical protein